LGKGEKMRLIFPTDEDMGYLSKRGAHFGKAKYYTIITLKDNVIADVESTLNPGHSGGACGNAVTNIMSLKPDGLIVSGIGGSPAQGFSKAGLDLYFDRTSTTVQESIEAFLLGKLEKSAGEGTCSTH
jgi:predicted Fe-Mo cluster-binding NifX family protein